MNWYQSKIKSMSFVFQEVLTMSFSGVAVRTAVSAVPFSPPEERPPSSHPNTDHRPISVQITSPHAVIAAHQPQWVPVELRETGTILIISPSKMRQMWIPCPQPLWDWITLNPEQTMGLNTWRRNLTRDGRNLCSTQEVRSISAPAHQVQHGQTRSKRHLWMTDAEVTLHYRMGVNRPFLYPCAGKVVSVGMFRL